MTKSRLNGQSMNLRIECGEQKELVSSQNSRVLFLNQIHSRRRGEQNTQMDN